MDFNFRQFFDMRQKKSTTSTDENKNFEASKLFPHQGSSERLGPHVAEC